MRTEEQWKAAHDYVKEVLECYVELIGKPRVNPSIGIAVIHGILVKYSLGDRTEELFLEMNEIK